MTVSILVPYRYVDDWRAQVLGYVLARWRRLVPDADIVLGGSPPGPFNRSAAVNHAASLAAGDTFVVADADVIVSGVGLRRALHSGRWGFPFDVYFTMTEAWTRRQMDMPDGDIAEVAGDDPDDRDVVHRHPGKIAAACESGCLIVGRDVFETVGGFDQGFVGWGFEDRAFVGAVTRQGGPPCRPRANALHLWHPVPPGHDPNAFEVRANRDRYKRLAAAGFPREGGGAI